MAVDHYENFPVASILLPSRLRSAVKAIYAFARRADDIADEGDASTESRLAELAAFRSALDHMRDMQFQATQFDNAPEAIFLPLQAEILRHALPISPFYDLLTAFDRDARHQPVRNDNELLDYCRYSANPVGRLLLHLYRADEPDALAWSDHICSGLQLVNFWQDVAIDARRGRYYLPLDCLAAHGMSHADLDRHQLSVPWPELMRERVQFARSVLLSGAPLCRRLQGRPGMELRLIMQGGLRILEKIDAINGDVFRHRPVLHKKDWVLLAWRSLTNHQL